MTKMRSNSWRLKAQRGRRRPKIAFQRIKANSQSTAVMVRDQELMKTLAAISLSATHQIVMASRRTPTPTARQGKRLEPSLRWGSIALLPLGL